MKQPALCPRWIVVANWRTTIIVNAKRNGDHKKQCTIGIWYWVCTNAASYPSYLNECNPLSVNQLVLSTPVVPQITSIAQSCPMVQPTVPLAVQSGGGSTTFKEYVEQTVMRVRASPQEPPLERSCTTMLGILI
ncbi:MAG: hypothetical protein MI921_06940 [Cytophagales bacterium]|nr:hypothetical protein [Cytophagales bacterium]